jgi:hypothetical protein
MKTDTSIELNRPHMLVLTALLVLVVLIAFVFTISTGSVLPFTAFLFVPFLVYMIRVPHLWMLSVFVVMTANLTIPGLPQGIMAYHVLAAGFVVLMAAKCAIQRPKRSGTFGWSIFFAAAYMCVVALMITVHGFGLRFIGDEMWGGAAYLRLFIAFCFLWASEFLTISETSWKRFMWFAVLGAMVPVMSYFVFLFSGGAMSWQFLFVKDQASAIVGTLRASASGKGVVRYTLMASVAQTLLMLLLTIMRWRWLGIGAILVLGTSFLSGFRSSLLILVMTGIVYAVMYKKEGRMKRVMVLLFCTITVVVALIPIVRKLPLSAQRSLSIIPLYHVAPEAELDADSTATWRIEIWKLMLHNIPKYFWLGSGVAVNAAAAYSTNPYFLCSPEGAYEYHNYHNGPLGILHDYGIFGLLTVLGFMISSSLEFSRFRKIFVTGTFLHRFYMFFLAAYIAQILSFLIIFGDVFDSVAVLLFASVMLRGVIRTRLVQLSESEATTVASGEAT